MSLRRLLLVSIIITSGATLVSAQEWLSHLPSNRTNSFVAMQQAFAKWAEGRDLGKERYWKWYQRFEAHHAPRSLANGEPAGMLSYWRAFQQLERNKDKQRTILASSGWSPYGPSELPQSVSNTGSGLGRINCISFHPDDPDIFWIGVGQGGIWKTVNGGESWLPLGDELPIMRVSDIAVDPNDPETLYVSLGDYAYVGSSLRIAGSKLPSFSGIGVFKSTDGGGSWWPTGLSLRQEDLEFSLIRRVFVHPANSRRLLAAGISGVWLSEDGGEQWTPTFDGLLWDIEREARDPNTLYATTTFVPGLPIGASGIHKTSDFGASWTELPHGLPARDATLRIEIGIAPSNADIVYAVACGTDWGFHSILRSTDAGASWTARAFRATSPNILGYDNGSQPGGQATYDLAIHVHPNNPETVYVGGINLWGSSDGGQTWDGVSSGSRGFAEDIHVDQQFLAHNPLNDRWYICNDGGLYATDAIEIGSWQSVIENPDYRFPTDWDFLGSGMEISSFYRLGLSANNEGYVIAGAQDNSTMTYNREDWLITFFGDGMEGLIHPDNPDIVYGSSQNGRFYRSLDGGLTLDARLTEFLPDRGEFTTPFVMHPREPATLFAAYGDVWRSDDRGDSWRAISNFASLPGSQLAAPSTALAIAPSDPRHLYVAKRRMIAEGQPAQMWKSSDAGESWTNISAGLPDSLYFSYIAVHSSDPATAWLSCSGFFEGLKVYQTTNGGEDWINVSGNLPNFPLNCVVHDSQSPHNTLYVGTDIGVFYRNDVLSEWRPFDENLPNVIVSELEIHAASNKIYAATFGRGIWLADLIDPVASSAAAIAEPGFSAELHPVPNKGQFTMSVDGLSSGALVSIQIVNVTGRTMYREELRSDEGQLRRSFDLDLPYGAYYLRIHKGTRSRVLRFVVEE